MKVTLLQNYDWPIPGTRNWIAFKAGWSGRVTRAQGRDMIAAGAGAEVTIPDEVKSTRKGPSRAPK